MTTHAAGLAGPLDLVLCFDGGCWPNPGGVPTYGWHLDTRDGVGVAEGRGVARGLVPEQRTNNTAELLALYAGLSWVAGCRVLHVDRLIVYGDSQLAVNLFNGTWRAKKPWLADLTRDCQEVAASLDAGHLEAMWHPREHNRRADALAGVVVPNDRRGHTPRPAIHRGEAWEPVTVRATR